MNDKILLNKPLNTNMQMVKTRGKANINPNRVNLIIPPIDNKNAPNPKIDEIVIYLFDVCSSYSLLQILYKITP